MEKKDKKTIQFQFIQAIKDVIPSNLSIVDELADLLQLSNDSVYRRLRGETALTIDEVAVICKQYHLSFDDFNNTKTDTVTFTHKSGEEGQEGFAVYLNSLLDDILYLKSEEDTRFIFAAEDIPVFHYFNYTHLTVFKLFYWMKSVISHPDFLTAKFNAEKIDAKLLEVTQKLYQEYQNVPSVEIWTEETIMSTIKQIEYYWESGLFIDRAQIGAVINDLKLMLGDVEQMSEKSYKKGLNKAKFEMYKSDVLIGNNTIITEVNNIKATYLNYNTFNYIMTTSSSFCEETDKWLNNLIKKSTLISGVAEKQRYQFFKNAYQQIEELENKLQ